MENTRSNLLKEEFDLHVEQITDTHKGFVDNTTKVAGFLLLALGWIVTSSTAREYLVATPDMAIIAAIAVAAAYMLSVGASWIGYRVSNNAIRRLNDLSYLPRSAYEGRILDPITFVVCLAGNGVLSALLMIALLTAT